MLVLSQLNSLFAALRVTQLHSLDLFAIPDFAAGAMENWGLVTYRETALLYNEAENPQRSKQRVAIVIAHELAHQVIIM